MAETKFIKGKCNKTGRYFGLEIKQNRSRWEVVNFLEIPEEEARVITSEIRQDSFETAKSLLPCEKCGSRKVSGCNCTAKRCPVQKGTYNFQCVYCKNMEIDYSTVSSLAGYKEGDVIRLSQGQEVKITFNGKPLKRVVVGLGWDPAVGVSKAMDLDSSVIVMGSDSYETVYFGDKTHPSGCVVHHGDNLTGAGSDQSDDENIDAYLDLVPRTRDKLAFVVNIYDCINRHQNLGSVRNMYIKLYDPDSRKVLIEYRVDGNLRSSTSLIVGVVSRDGQDWKFKAVGAGSNATSVSQLARECFDKFVVRGNR